MRDNKEDFLLRTWYRCESFRCSETAGPRELVVAPLAPVQTLRVRNECVTKSRLKEVQL
jgi:hypothetical protein